MISEEETTQEAVSDQNQMALRTVFGVRATLEPAAFVVDAEITDSAGDTYRCEYFSRESDPYGLNPVIRQWLADNIGEYEILPYAPPPEPTPEERRAAMPPLERWRLNTIIDLQPGLRDRINTAIEDLPEPNRTITRNKLADVQQYYRTDPLFDLLGAHPGIDLSPEDIDAMWADGLALN